MTQKRFATGGIGAIAILATFALYLTVARGSSDPNQVMDTVDPQLLADTNGTQLDRPSAAETKLATVAESQAVDTALKADPSYSVRESKLVILHTPVVLADGCLCWAVSLYPPGGKLGEVPPPGGSPSKRDNIYYLSFVDARTGELLYSAQGGRQIEPVHVNPDAYGTALPTPSGTPGAER
jgi:hypothetical protein